MVFKGPKAGEHEVITQALLIAGVPSANTKIAASTILMLEKGTRQCMLRLGHKIAIGGYSNDDIGTFGQQLANLGIAAQNPQVWREPRR